MKVTFTETYTYTIEIDVEKDENIEDVIHEVPLLIDRDPGMIEDIRNNGNFNFYNEYTY